MLKRSLVTSIIALLLVISAYAQNPQISQDEKRLLKTVTVFKSEEKAKVDKSVKRRPKKRIVKRTTEDRPIPFLLGDVTVSINSDRHDHIKIGMAAGGITIIEFPSDDKFFAVHLPKNGDWLEMDKSPSIASDTHLVLRAGKDLLSAKGPAAIVGTQMESGLTVSFLVYPAKQVWKQTGRVIVKYDKGAIIKEREKAGLSVNLFERAEKPEEKATSLQSPPVSNVVTPNDEANEKSLEEKKNEEERVRRFALAQKVLNNSKSKYNSLFKKWTKKRNGLELSTYSWDMDPTTLAVALVIKNTEESPIRLIEGNPSVIVETLDDKGKSLQFAPVESINATSNLNGVIPARGMVFYSFIYKPQILSKKQRLHVSVAQMNAADEPAIAELNTNL